MSPQAELKADAIAVLVVEDESLARMNATMMLKTAGYIVFEADSGASGLEQLRLHPEITILFTDINMPGEFDGLELARQAHLLRPDVHLILTSGLIRPHIHELFGGDFIAKPYDDLKVADLIRAGAARVGAI
jgi:CheY-like chemotaxis protein